MASNWTESEKMIYASYVMMEVAAMQAENEICKANEQYPKFDGGDFYKASDWAISRLRNDGW